MKNETLDEIVKFATKQLTAKYGYCGTAIGPEFAMLNSDDGNGNDILIKVTLKPE